MGGSWYYRTLSFRQYNPAPPLAVGLGFDVQEVPAIQPQHWDIPCAVVVTETSTLLRSST